MFYLEKSQSEVVLFPMLLGLLAGPLSCSRTDEKPWSATRRVGETHQAGGESASFWSVCKSLLTTAGRFLFTSGWTVSFFQTCVNWQERSRKENSLGVTSSHQRTGGEEEWKAPEGRTSARWIEMLSVLFCPHIWTFRVVLGEMSLVCAA